MKNKREKESSSICQHIPQMAARASAKPGQSQEPGAPSGIHVVGKTSKPTKICQVQGKTL